MNYSKRSDKKELLDSNTIPFKDIANNMRELNFINTYLGGHAITVEGFKKILQARKHISVCEIGCGGGDNLYALQKFCKQNNIDATFTGIDINADCISFAKENSALYKVHFIVSDYRLINFETIKPDIIFSSLFCHHFSDEELINMLQWMKSNSSIGFFINDLHRHFVAYNFIKFATKLFSSSYLVKNDAPLSILRSFKKNEWKNLLSIASITSFSIQWKWAFRFLIIVQNS